MACGGSEIANISLIIKAAMNIEINNIEVLLNLLNKFNLIKIFAVTSQ